MSEVLLDEVAIHRFRTRYREQFGHGLATTTRSTIRSAPAVAIFGMEHWLPLYYEALETVFDYLPRAALTLDYQAIDGRDVRLRRSPIFTPRGKTMPPAARGAAPVYRPVRPEQLYLDAAEWDAAHRRARRRRFHTPFAAPDHTNTGQLRCRGAPRPQFCRGACHPKINVVDTVRDYLAEERAAGAASPWLPSAPALPTA